MSLPGGFNDVTRKRVIVDAVLDAISEGPLAGRVRCTPGKNDSGRAGIEDGHHALTIGV